MNASLILHTYLLPSLQYPSLYSFADHSKQLIMPSCVIHLPHPHTLKASPSMEVNPMYLMSAPGQATYGRENWLSAIKNTNSADFSFLLNLTQ